MTPPQDHDEANTRDAIHAAGMAALWTFLGMFSVTLLGWLGQVAEWAGAPDSVAFPSVSVLGQGAVSAAVAAAAFAITAVIRLAQVRGWVPGNPPKYERT